MSKSLSPLAVLQIAEPCSQSWDAMAGDAKARFCSHCQKHVHDLSAMNLDEAERLLCKSAGSLCVRFQRDADGRVITLDYRPQEARRRLRLPLAISAAISALAAATIFAKKPFPAKPVIMMGACPQISRPPFSATTNAAAKCPPIAPAQRIPDAD